MSNRPVHFTARDGRALIAYEPFTVNSTEVLTELAWAYTRGQKTCDLAHCPSDQNGYCLECHMVAAEVRDIASLALTGKPYPTNERLARNEAQTSRHTHQR